MTDTRGSRGVRLNPAGLVTGIALIGVGVAVLLDQLGLADAGELIGDWWPVLIVAAGVAALLNGQRTGAFITLAIGGLLLVGTTDAWGVDGMELVWPLALIAGGGWLLFTRSGGRAPAVAAADPTNAVNAWALFSGRRVNSLARPLRGGQLTAVFGGVDADLRNAELPPEGATIEVTAIFGGVDLIVPPGWRVQMSGPAVFGGYDDKTIGAAGSGPVLHLRCLVLFGGAEVKTGTPAVPPAPTDAGVLTP